MRDYVKKNWKSLLAAAIIILMPIAVGVALWDRLPEQMATHWGLHGEANGWTSRRGAVFGMPLFLLAIHVIGVMVSETNGKNNGQNPKALRLMHFLCPALSLLVSAVMYGYALGYNMNVETAAPLVLLNNQAEFASM